MRTSLILLSLLGGSASLSAETIARGPYLQMGASTAMSVRWRTDLAGSTKVWYGTTAGNLTLSASLTGTRTEHEVRLTGLTTNTRYYYAVGNATTQLAGDATYTFVTHPATGAARYTRMWILGDSGTGDANAGAVRDAYVNTWGQDGTDLVLLLGDNAYNSGTDAEYQSTFFSIYPTQLRRTVFWATLGNHETAQSTNPALTIPYFQNFTNPTAAESGGVSSGTEKYYAFDYANVHVVSLDSMTSDRSVGGTMYTWLANDLAATRQRWIIAIWHHPPYTKGSHDSDTETELTQMRANFLPLLEDYGVDLVLCGHSHSYERSYLLDGHYGTSSTLTAAMKKNAGNGRPDGNGNYSKDVFGHRGTVYAVSGSAGKISGGALNHPAMVTSQNVLGSMVIEVDGDRMDGSFVTSTGAVGDWFTLLKNDPGRVAVEAVVRASADDAEQNTATGAVNLTSTDLELISDGAATQVVGMRFPAVAVPKDAKVHQSQIQFSVDEATSGATSLTLKGQAADNAAAFTATTNDISNRATTGASVAWSPAAWTTLGSIGAEARTPSLNTIVQEILNRAGWASGNTLGMIVTGSVSRVAESADLANSYRPSLRIVYSPPKTIDVPVNGSANDAEENLAGNAVSLISTDLELITDGIMNQMVGMRFTSLAIPKNAVISEAWIQFTIDEATSAATTVAIAAEATDNAAVFAATTSNLSARTRTANPVSWSPAAWSRLHTSNSEARTPSLNAVVQQVVNRAGWASGNAMVFLVTGSGSRVVESADLVNGRTPVLHVKWQ